jgi:hypothetical protein
VEETVEMSETIDREGALLWLNDRVGQRVLVNLSVYSGGRARSVLSAVGELQHRTAQQSPLVGRVRAALKENLAGLYAVGPCGLDLGDPSLRCDYTIREASTNLAKLEGAAELVIRPHGGAEVTITPAAGDADSEIDA